MSLLKKIKQILFGADKELSYMIVDLHFKNPTDIFIVRFDRKERRWELIADRKSSNKTYLDIITEINELIKKYNIPKDNICVDAPVSLRNGRYY
jgi:hypothetical protein